VTLVKIKIAQFQYYEEVGTKTHKRTGEEVPILSSRFGRHGQIVDITRDEDLDRGEKMGAFTDDTFSEEGPTDPDEPESESDEPDDTSWRHDDLVAWIRDDQPSAREVVTSAENDPEKAKKLMAAEKEASGSQPRKSVMDPLRKIAER
jgi:hypothetical protein